MEEEAKGEGEKGENETEKKLNNQSGVVSKVAADAENKGEQLWEGRKETKAKGHQSNGGGGSKFQFTN